MVLRRRDHCPAETPNRTRSGTYPRTRRARRSPHRAPRLRLPALPLPLQASASAALLLLPRRGCATVQRRVYLGAVRRIVALGVALLIGGCGQSDAEQVRSAYKAYL